MHVGDAPGGEAEVAEDDVLDTRCEERVAVGPHLLGLLVEQVQDHREVVDAERPERVLVLADHAEVLAIAVDAEDVAEVARVDHVLHLLHAGVVEQQVAGHQDELALRGEADELLHLHGAHRGRLLDEDVLPRFERLLRERVVGRHRRRDDDCLEVGSGEHLCVVLVDRDVRIARGEPPAQLRVEVAERDERAEIVEVPREVRAPVAEADQADARLAAGHSLKTFSDEVPLAPVALRRSTTSWASSTSAS